MPLNALSLLLHYLFERTWRRNCEMFDVYVNCPPAHPHTNLHTHQLTHPPTTPTQYTHTHELT